MWFFRHVSLRTQLVAIMAVLMLLGVFGIAWATAQSTQSALVGRIDDSLRSSYSALDSSLQTALHAGDGAGGSADASGDGSADGAAADSADGSGADDAGEDGVDGGDVADTGKDAKAVTDGPSGSSSLYAALYSEDGDLLIHKSAFQVDDRPRLGRVRAAEVADHQRVPYTVRGEHADSRGWRVLVVDSSEADRTVVVAAPLKDTVYTVQRATASILVTGTLATMLMSMVGYAIVTRAFRPLRRVERTAGAIAKGELSRRVEEYPIETEVGRLSYSLNAMLSQIETAFRAMGASEEKMRRFIQDASHELRTPLVTIRGYSELYRHGGIPEGEPLDQAMGRIESEAKRMSQLVEDLLTLARLDEERPLQAEPVDLLVLAGDAVADAAVNAPDRRVRLVGIDGARPESAPTMGDEAKLRQVVVNLMTNALRYTPEGTPLEVAVGVRPVMEGRSDAILAVVDHGNGIPEADAQRIFERFYRADSSRQRQTGGTGLGLAIVAAIAKQHDGGIRLSETPGGGATMSLHIPYVPGVQVSEESDDSFEDGLSGGGSGGSAGSKGAGKEPETATGVMNRLRAVTRWAGESSRRVGEATRRVAEGHHKHPKDSGPETPDDDGSEPDHEAGHDAGPATDSGKDSGPEA